MKHYFAYTRVSTAKQGEQGVSLREQADAIRRYADHNSLEISQWFEERVTAAKQGRPVFTTMLRLLKRGKAQGMIIHKIDRSARNLRDWADLGELIDRDIDVRFVNESIDLRSRGGRLSADIQAVVAADYVRNLKEEAQKGIRGRWKQGLFPGPAPLGYLDNGGGKPKSPDPLRAPLVRKAFELYSTGRFSLNQLAEEVARVGLKNRYGHKISKNGLSVMLSNPFYIGLIHVKRTGETYAGAHLPLLRRSIFDRVQAVLSGKHHRKQQSHEFLFRRLISCGHCRYSLVGERQKGHVYYRCHTRQCPTKAIREERIISELEGVLRPLRFSEEERSYLKARVGKLKADWGQQKNSEIQSVRLRLDALRQRLGRLTDAYIDQVIEKDLFEDNKKALLLERQGLEQLCADLESGSKSTPDRVSEFLELAESASLSCEIALPDEKRDLIGIVTSNRLVDGKDVVFTLKSPFREIADRASRTNGGPDRAERRTLDSLIVRIWKYLSKHEDTPTTLKRSSEEDHLRI